MWNYEHSSVPRFERIIASGPPPGKYWLAVFLLVDDTCTVIASPESSRRTTLDNIERIANSPSDEDLAELTLAERAIIPGWVKLRDLARKALTGTDVTKLSASISDLHDWLSTLTSIQANNQQDTTVFNAFKALSISEEDRQRILLPLRSDIQSLFLVAEFLQAATRLCDAASRLAKNKTQKWWQAIPTKEIASLRTVVEDVFKDTVRRPALDWTNRLAEKGVGDVEDGARRGRTGEMVCEILGESKSTWIRSVSGSLVQGATDALDAVLKIKLA